MKDFPEGVIVFTADARHWVVFELVDRSSRLSADTFVFGRLAWLDDHPAEG